MLVFHYDPASSDTGTDVGVLWSDESDWEPLLDGPWNETLAMISPDGGWIAYTSDETGQHEVYARRFPGQATSESFTRRGDGASLVLRWG